MKNWVVAAVAIAMGVAVSAALLLLTSSSRGEVEVYAMARDVSAGELIAPDAVRLEPVVLPSGHATLFTGGQLSDLEGLRAAHDLMVGQLLQRGDVAGARTIVDSRLVLLPVKDAPPVQAGEKVDLFVISGTPENPAVLAFAMGVEVRAAVTGGLVVAVPSKEATAFVYAGEVMRLVAVVAAPDSPAGSEPPVDSVDQAMAAVAQP
jgi:hypothetical protein